MGEFVLREGTLDKKQLQYRYRAPPLVKWGIVYLLFLLVIFALNIVLELSKERTWWALFWILVAGIVILYKATTSN